MLQLKLREHGCHLRARGAIVDHDHLSQRLAAEAKYRFNASARARDIGIHRDDDVRLEPQCLTLAVCAAAPAGSALRAWPRAESQSSSSTSHWRHPPLRIA